MFYNLFNIIIVIQKISVRVTYVYLSPETKNIYQVRVILDRLLEAGLKINATKWSYVLKDIPQLGYIIS